jgi:hypothetical protein
MLMALMLIDVDEMMILSLSHSRPHILLLSLGPMLIADQI